MREVVLVLVRRKVPGRDGAGEARPARASSARRVSRGLVRGPGSAVVPLREGPAVGTISFSLAKYDLGDAHVVFAGGPRGRSRGLPGRRAGTKSTHGGPRPSSALPWPPLLHTAQGALARAALLGPPMRTLADGLQGAPSYSVVDSRAFARAALLRRLRLHAADSMAFAMARSGLLGRRRVGAVPHGVPGSAGAETTRSCLRGAAPGRSWGKGGLPYGALPTPGATPRSALALLGRALSLGPVGALVLEGADLLRLGQGHGPVGDHLGHLRGHGGLLGRDLGPGLRGLVRGDLRVRRRFSRCSRAFAWCAATSCGNSAAALGNFVASSPCLAWRAWGGAPVSARATSEVEAIERARARAETMRFLRDISLVRRGRRLRPGHVASPMPVPRRPLRKPCSA